MIVPEWLRRVGTRGLRRFILGQQRTGGHLAGASSAVTVKMPP